MLLASLTITAVGCGKKETSVNDESLTAVAVKVEAAAVKPIENNVSYTGEIKAAETTSVSAKISGPCVTVYKNVGDFVNAGEVLLKIDETDYRTQYNSAQAGLNQAQAAYNAASRSGRAHV